MLLVLLAIVFTSVTSLEQCEKDSCTSKDDYESNIYPELLGLGQEDPVLIKAIKEKVLIPPPPKKAKLSNLKLSLTWEKLKGQFGQVDLLVQDGPKMGIDMKQKGFFIEAGASDGEELSNTLYLEQKLKWTGRVYFLDTFLVVFCHSHRRPQIFTAPPRFLQRQNLYHFNSSFS